ncbi:MAG TPA: oligosaccharide flippase family protein [Candidatus Omnitrophota bacterium]|nr:oligosaccharide flippase family protein [Candidatus Omnitrophota bacterium]
MHLRERIIKDTILYAMANYFAMGVGIFLSIVVKGILGPLGSGYFAMVKVFSSYGDLSDLGSRDAMLREVAQATGAKREDEAFRVRNVSFAFTLISAGFVVLLFIGIALFIKDPVLRKGVMIAGFLVFATQIYNFMITYLRVLKKIFTLSTVIVVNIIGVALCSIVGAYGAGVIGLVSGLVVSTSLAAFFAYGLSKTRIGVCLDARETFRLVRIGFPLVVSGYALNIFLSIDTIMIGKMIGYTQLGFYTIALMSIQQINSLGRFAQIILQPHIQEKYGQTGNLRDSKSLFVKSTRVLIYVLPLIIAMVFYGVPVIVHYFLPKFNDGLSSMRILVTAFYFVAVNEMSGSVLFTINKQARMIPIIAGMILIAIGLNYAFIAVWKNIEAVALATTLAYFLYFSIFFCYAFRYLMAKAELMRTVLVVIGIFCYMSVLLHGIEYFVHFQNPIAGSIAKFFVFLCFFSPFFFYFEKHDGVLKTVASVFLKKLKEIFCGRH